MPLHSVQPLGLARPRRVFFAIPSIEHCRTELAAAAKKAIRSCGGRPVLAADLHMTLAFVGEVPEDQISVLQEVGAALSAEAFELELDRVEHWARPHILCASSTQPSPAAEALVRSLRSTLETRNVRLDMHPWKAHVTLARNVLSPHLVGPMPPVCWPVTSFGLFESISPPQLPRYRAVALWPLGGGLPGS